MDLAVEFFTKREGATSRTVRLKSPIRLFQQPDRSWVLNAVNSQDAQSADIIRKSKDEFYIRPVREDADVMFQFQNGRIIKLPYMQEKKLLSRRTRIVFSIPK